jgi:hypothetical protein
MWYSICGRVYVVQYMWYSICGTVYVVQCMWYSICGRVYVVQYMWYSICGTVYVVHYTWYSICGTIYVVHYTWYSICGTVYVVEYMWYSICGRVYVVQYMWYSICGTVYKTTPALWKVKFLSPETAETTDNMAFKSTRIACTDQPWQQQQYFKGLLPIGEAGVSMSALLCKWQIWENERQTGRKTGITVCKML